MALVIGHWLTCTCTYSHSRRRC